MQKNIIYIGISFLIMIILLQIIKLIYKKFGENKKQIHLKFFKNFIQIFIVLAFLYTSALRFDAFKTFASTLLTSSSLLVVVLGFAFQTSLEDFICGILISIFKPFNVDDRIFLVNQNISGYIEDITIRHTIIRTFTNSRLIIPNSIMNKEIIENNHMIDSKSSGFLDVMITYDADIEKAKKIMKDLVREHPLTIKDEISEVYIRTLNENGVSLRITVTTENIDDNFNVCSDLRGQLIQKFKEEKIEIATNTIKVKDT